MATRVERHATAVATYNRSYFALTSGKSSFVYDPGDPDQIYTEFLLRYRTCYLGEDYRTLFVLHPNAGKYDARFDNLSADGATY